MGIVSSTLAVLVTPRSPKEKSQAVISIHIPDTLAHWPWPRAINPHYEECKAESDAWIQSFNVFSPKAQAAFNRCEFGLLAALGYPKLNRGILSPSLTMFKLLREGQMAAASPVIS